MRYLAPLTLGLASLASVGAAQGDWGKIATISSSMGVSASRLCLGEASRGDIGCPAYAPSVTTAGDVSVSRNLSAAKFIGDGSALTGINPTINDGMSGSLIFRTNTGALSASSTFFVSGTTIGIGTNVPPWLQYGVYAAGYLVTNGFVNLQNYSGETGLQWGGGEMAVYGNQSGSKYLRFLTNSAEVMRFIANGNAGIGTDTPNAALEVSGTTLSGVRSGAAGQGRLGFGVFYTGANIVNTLGTMYSSMDTTLGYAVKPKPAAYGFVSSAGNSNFAKGALQVSNGLAFSNAPNATVAIDSDVSLTPRFVVDSAGNVSISGVYRGDGSGLTNLPGASGDRIVSGTTSIVAQTASNIISITTNNVNTGYFNSNGVLTLPGISATANLTSVTSLYASGNVGIGTIAPTSILHIAGAPIGVSTLTYGNREVGLTLSSIGGISTAGAGPEIIFKGNNTGASVYASIAALGLGANASGTFGGMAFATKKATTGAALGETMRMDNAGNVGINTSVPSTKLEVNGTVSATNFVGDGSGLTNLSISGDRIVSGTTRLVAQTASNIISITNGGTNTGYFNSNGVLTVPGISATQNLTSVTTLYASGNVGIGITNPTNLLHVNGTLRAGGARIGNMGDGNEPTYRGVLMIDSGSVDNATNGLEFRSAVGGGYGYRLATTSNGASNIDLRFQTRQASLSWTTPLIIAGANGNVGIGYNITPTTKLEVAGTISATNFVGNASGLTGISGDNLGNHIATQALSMGNYPITAASGFDATAPGGKQILLGGGSSTGSEIKFLYPGVAHYSIYNSGNGLLTVASTGNSAVTNTSGTALMTLDTAGNMAVRGNLTLSATNPVIASGGTWIQVLNGMYFSGGTSYFQTNTNFRGGITNDTGSVLTINGGASGTTYFPNTVGIGTSTPAYKLDVTGDMNASANLREAGIALASKYGQLAGANTWTTANYFQSNKGASSVVGTASAAYALEAYSTDGGAAGMSFHRAGNWAVNMGLDPDNVFRIGGFSAPANLLQMDMSGNLTMAGNVTAAGVPLRAVNRQVITASGTWTKPSGYSSNAMTLIQCWGAGGGGFYYIGQPTQATGGGGGGYKERWIPLASLGATETVTLGAGGVGGSGGAGGNGGNTTFGSWLTAYGGKGGAYQAGGAGGNMHGTVNPVALMASDGVTAVYGIQNPWDGGNGSAPAGNCPANTACGHAVYGGAGGGAYATSNVTPISDFGGAGGVATSTGNNGAQPGGGGSGSWGGKAGDGGAGQCNVSVFN